ncbi:putative helicase MOV-10 [Corticium candelabrum]|uniref:putative helicase MOV-10 n=1 Tax=Corticium candelabrum TaxID=121492 RepID=UPI002E25B1E3|nr:putative helicase MOV-10 [Corticium candelabrum]
MRLVQLRSQYVPFNPRPKRRRRTIIDGVRPPGPHYRIPMVRELAEYRIPPEINEYKINDRMLDELTADLQNSHSKRFHKLLHIEEKQMYRDIRRYDRKKELSQTPGGYLTLKVEGLAENRPSLLKGDHILATCESHHHEYKGYVHRVEKEEVWLKFDRMFHRQFIRGQKYDIRFTFNRLPLRLQHRALDISNKTLPRELLFPTITASSKPVLWNPKTKPLTFYDRDVASNREQSQAVEMIVSGYSRPAPYLIFGPPGTGKTKTTVEAIKQVLKCIPESRILACAPSNSATDLLCERLLTHVPKDQGLRLNAFSRPRSTDIPGTVMEVSCYDDDTGSFEMPQLAKLKQYRVILSTLITAGRLVSISLPSNHFSHIFIDESGHAVEPECLVPVAGLLNTDNPKGGQLVLAGDPKQLGPVLRSHIAIKHGLQTSLLERLMTQCDVYQRKSSTHYNPHVLTKLLQNYRSHPDILCIPNETFYNNELKVKADPLVRTSLCRWEHLPKQDFPIIFHGIEGEDQREENSPSFFNPQEAIIVHRYIAQLIGSRGIRVNAREIGVISPYRKQVEKIRTVLRAKGFESVKVGSVEEFQGQERRIIIISTVRSNPTFLAIDRDYKLGFLDNPKRFNVAITRAKALLVVVGNPKLLSRDKHWKTFLQFVCRKGGYVGIEFKDVSVADQSLLDRIQELELHRHDSYTASTGEQDNEPTSSETEWRNEE